MKSWQAGSPKQDIKSIQTVPLQLNEKNLCTLVVTKIQPMLSRQLSDGQVHRASASSDGEEVQNLTPFRPARLPKLPLSAAESRRHWLFAARATRVVMELSILCGTSIITIVNTYHSRHIARTLELKNGHRSNV